MRHTKRRNEGKRSRKSTDPSTLFVGCVVVLLVILLYATVSTVSENRRMKVLRASMEEMHRRKKTEGFTLFHLDKSRFVWAFADCLADPDCTIQYMHVAKTGGTYLKWAMNKILDVSRVESYEIKNIWYTWHRDCCGEELKGRFLADPSSYCRRPFASYQTQQKIFTETMVETCKQLRKRVVVLTSFREPLTRALSWIHQVCNKNLRWRQEDELRACERCTYEADLDFFNRFKTLQGLDATMLSNSTFWSIMHGHDMLAIDNADFNEFLHLLEGALPASYEHQFKFLFEHTQAKNEEEIEVCNFRVPSAMVKNYKDELLLYRKIVLGDRGR
mmetsp:Transcript_8458/g.15692  ORF Transcript_8458/g.15692 Transcript_8458/m.15692 type:complete len:331 (-) Transcript_8458:120-1112(-)